MSPDSCPLERGSSAATSSSEGGCCVGLSAGLGGCSSTSRVERLPDWTFQALGARLTEVDGAGRLALSARREEAVGALSVLALVFELAEVTSNGGLAPQGVRYEAKRHSRSCHSNNQKMR